MGYFEALFIAFYLVLRTFSSTIRNYKGLCQITDLPISAIKITEVFVFIYGWLSILKTCERYHTR